MANAVLCRFSFSEDWTGLQKMLVFTNGVETRNVVLDGDECYIPHEVLAVPRVRVRVGVYGTDGENVILPTIWANLGDVHDAPDPSEMKRRTRHFRFGERSYLTSVTFLIYSQKTKNRSFGRSMKSFKMEVGEQVEESRPIRSAAFKSWIEQNSMHFRRKIQRFYI